MVLSRLPGTIGDVIDGVDGVGGVESPELAALSAPWLLLVAVGASLLALLVAVVVGAVVSRIGRRSPLAADLSHRGRRPLRVLLVLLALLVVLSSAAGDARWAQIAVRVLGLALIAAVAWVVGVIAFVVEDIALRRYRLDVADNLHARRIRTQVSLLRRLTVAVLVVLAAAAMLLTFPGARAAGASVLASAGLIGIVAGLAAQSSLANVFAGIQLAFSDAIRVDDVVIVEGEWGRIEEITMTYVVVHIWDDRRLILPSTYFTTTPFQHWTRKDAALLGAVELDLDWSVPLEPLRELVDRVLEGSELWDRRVKVVQVTDAVGSFVRIRVLVSAVDAPTAFDLRCLVREEIVTWLQREHPHALPRIRTEVTSSDDVRPLVPSSAPAEDAAPARPATKQQGLFTGSHAAVERSRSFAGPGEEAMHDRGEPDPDAPPPRPAS